MRTSSWAEQIEMLCRESWGQVIMEMEKKPEYAKVKEREEQLIKAILEKMDDAHKLNQLIDCVTEFPDLEKLAVYQQAMRDCMFLLNWLGLLNFGTMDAPSES